MAHFHKSHVSVFVARGMLTRGRSPNTESIKTRHTAPAGSTATSINAERRSENFMRRRRGNVLSSEERLMKESVCVCVCLKCVCILHFLKSDHMPSRGRANGFSPNLHRAVFAYRAVYTHAHAHQVLWGKSSRTPGVRVRAAVAVSMETAT